MLINSEKIKSGFSKSIFFLLGVIIVGFIIRINYVYDDIPLTLDAFRYFLLGIDFSLLGNFPADYNKTNSGWSLFLALIFQSSNSNDYLDYMMMQKISSVIFSVITAIPLYFLAQKFFRKEIAMIGVCFFVFSPYIIENSILGITDSFFIFLIVSFFALFFSNQKRNIVFSFFILGLSSIVRYESLLLIIPTTIIFLHRFKGKNNFKFYSYGLLLFLLAIIPVAIWKIQMGIPDGIVSHLWGGAQVVINENSLNSFTEDRFDLIRGMLDLPKFIVMSLLPLCFIFVPYSIISLIKKENNNFRYLIFLGIFSLIPALYAYSRGFEDTRYVFILLPVLIIASLFLIERLNQIIKRNNLILIVLILLIIISSIIYLDFRQTDYEREKEVLKIAEFVSKLDGKSNDYGPEAYYVEVMDLNEKEFPILSNQINFKSKIILLEGDTIIERINDAKNKEVSYLVVTSNTKDRIFLDVYDNQENYVYLEKIFDSEKDNSKFKVKIFKINFEKFISKI